MSNDLDAGTEQNTPGWTEGLAAAEEIVKQLPDLKDRYKHWRYFRSIIPKCGKLAARDYWFLSGIESGLHSPKFIEDLELLAHWRKHGG